MIQCMRLKNLLRKKYMTNENSHFTTHWTHTIAQKKGQEFSLFVPTGKKPQTQRQFNLYHYFEHIKRTITTKPYKTSLELGAGRGTISLYLKKQLGFEVTLNDLSSEAMDLARANFALHNETANFVVSDATKLPFPDNSFDLVTSIGLMEHLENYQPILKEAYRVLRKGGCMIQINIPQKKSIQILNIYYRRILKFFRKQLKEDFPRNHDTPEQYAHNARSVGFINVQTHDVNPFPLFVPLPLFVDRILTKLYRGILYIRTLLNKNPFQCSHKISVCHFLTGYK